MTEDLSGEFAAMVDERDVLVGEGLWRSGPRTLLGAIGVQYREIMLTAGLAWLLQPDGHHRMGSAVLDGFLRHLDIEPAPANVSREVTRFSPAKQGAVRADLVVASESWTVVVEAKVLAGESDRQLEYLHGCWRSDPEPTFVFLNPDGRQHTSAAGTPWKQITWADVAQIIRTAMASSPHSEGVEDYVSTLEGLHPVDDSDSADPKAQLYLDHWRSIEEFVALRASAAEMLQTRLRALDEAIKAFADEVGATFIGDITDGGYAYSGLTRDHWNGQHQDLSVCVEWVPKSLLQFGEGYNKWPFVVVDAQPELGVRFLDRLRDELGDARAEFGGNKPHDQCLLWQYIEPPSHGALDPEALCESALKRLRELWYRVSPVLDELSVPAT